MLVAIGCAVVGSVVSGAEPDGPVSNRVTHFSLPDVAGKKHALDQWQDQQAVVLFFIGTECPVSNGYSPDMQAIAAEYAARGVICFGIHADPSVSAADASAHAKDYALSFPILLDREQRLAEMTGARVTPDAIVLSPDGTVRYRGRIDDRYASDGKRRDDPTTHELVDALEAVLAGKVPAIAETKAFGCPLPVLRSKGH